MALLALDLLACFVASRIDACAAFFRTLDVLAVALRLTGSSSISVGLPQSV
jgi:hypothetical protein